MRSPKHVNLFTVLIITILSLFDENLSYAQYRQAPAHLNLQLERIETRIEEKNAHIEEAGDKLKQNISQAGEKSRQISTCRRQNRFTHMLRCRHLKRELSHIREERIYWKGIFDKQVSEKRSLITKRDQLKQQIEEERKKNLCIIQSRNRSMVDEFLKSGETKIAQEIDYDTVENGRCNDENNYFESQIDSSHDNEDFDLSIDRRCTYRALKKYNLCGICGEEKSKNCFLKCEGANPQNAKPEFVSTGPCISRQLHHSTHQALTEISSCLQLDPKILFSLFAMESGFHPVKKSCTKATGMGQVTGIFIKDINNRFFDNYKNEIFPALSKNPLTKEACQSIIDKMNDSGKMQEFPLCQRTDFYMNTLYSAISHIKFMNNITQKLLAHQNRSNTPIPRNSPFRHALSSANIGRRTKSLLKTLAVYQTLEPNDRKIITELSFYSHNSPRIPTLFQVYLDDTGVEGNKLGDTDEDEFTGIRGRWRQYLENNRALISSSKNRQNEILGYIYPRTEGQGGLRRVERGDGRDFMKGRLTEIEREGKGRNSENRERIYCRPVPFY